MVANMTHSASSGQAKRILCIGTVTRGGEVKLQVKTPTQHDSLMEAAFAVGRQLWSDGADRSACRNAYELAGYDEAAESLRAAHPTRGER